MHASMTVHYSNIFAYHEQAKKTNKKTASKTSTSSEIQNVIGVFTLQLVRSGYSHAWFLDDSCFWEGSVLTRNGDIWPWLLFSPWRHKNCDVPVSSLKEVVNCQLNSTTWKNFLISMTNREIEREREECIYEQEHLQEYLNIHKAYLTIWLYSQIHINLVEKLHVSWEQDKMICVTPKSHTVQYGTHGILCTIDLKWNISFLTFDLQCWVKTYTDMITCHVIWILTVRWQ